MKVVQILYSGLGGHGSVAFSLGAAAREFGTWTNSFLFVGIEPLLSDYEQTCKDNRMQYAYIATVPRRPWLAWPRIYKQLTRIRPDAIVLHSVKTILPCSLYALRNRISLIAVEHQLNALKTRYEWIVSTLLMILAQQVVVLTRDYRDDLRSGLGPAFRSSKVCVISNGVDVSIFAPKRKVAAPADRKVIVGMAARFTDTKRQAVLIQALMELRRDHQLIDWRLTLAGDGDNLDSIRDMIVSARLQDVIDLRGYLGEDNLTDWFHSLDIYAHASDGETLSTSLLQAMAMGLPIVGSAVAGIDSLLSAGDGCGLLVEGGTPHNFSTALNRLATDTDLAEDLADRARRQAVLDYSHEAMYAKYDRVVRECARLST